MITMLVFFTGTTGLQSASDTEYAKAEQYLKDRNELYFAIFPEGIADFKFLNDAVSIDRIEADGEIIAYANKNEFEKFLTRGLSYKVLTPPCFQTKVTMSDYAEYLREGGKPAASWNAYPTYSAYVQIMENFQTNYPQQAKLFELGQSVRNRKILALKVTANVSVSNGKPRMLQVSTVHGDEILNYINTLHVIDTLLSSYGVDARLTRLLDSVEFWFAPLLNPDGTYKGGDGTVNGATRYNYNGYDLNRNYPCPCGIGGNHAQFGLYSRREPEITAIKGLYERYYFQLGSDLHGGSEIVMWPYGSMSRRPCDEDWFIHVARQYVDTVHVACKNNGYMTEGQNGIGNIYHDLYECHGISSDYAIFHMRARSLPMETSNTKMVPENQITTYWNYNKQALVEFYEQLLTGVQGTVKDSRTKAPLVGVKVSETTHDFDSAYSCTDSAGFYLRFIQTGNWLLTFSKPGYVDTAISVNVANYKTKYPLNVELKPINETVKEDLVGTWTGQGVYSRNSNNGAWVKLSSPADLIAAGDLDGDGTDDLIGIWPSQGGVWVKYSQTGTWTKLASTALSISAGDINGDGRVDLVGTWGGQGTYYRNSVTGAWVQLGSPATLVTTGDLDGDGTDDLVGIWPSQGGVWAKYSQTGVWEKLTSTAIDIATGDMNGDGRVDLIGTWSGQGTYYRNSVTGTWVKLGSEATQVTTGDLDGDGTDDLIGIWPSQGGVWVKYSKTGAWEKLSSTAIDIATGKMRGGAALDIGSGPVLTNGSADESEKGPGGVRFKPVAVEETALR
jgi:hypothetical protein